VRDRREQVALLLVEPAFRRQVAKRVDDAAAGLDGDER
jgi:hypothetical protein